MTISQANDHSCRSSGSRSGNLHPPAVANHKRVGRSKAEPRMEHVGEGLTEAEPNQAEREKGWFCKFQLGVCLGFFFVSFWQQNAKIHTRPCRRASTPSVHEHAATLLPAALQHFPRFNLPPPRVSSRPPGIVSSRKGRNKTSSRKLHSHMVYKLLPLLPAPSHSQRAETQAP